MISAFAASIVEAWQELRVHKVRVLMSLIGVGVAVCGLTLVVGFGDMTQKGLVDSFEKEGGRDSTFTVSVTASAGEATTADREKITAALEASAKRFGIDYISPRGQLETQVQSPSGPVQATVNIVGPDYDVMHRLKVDSGRWFTDGDAANMSPPLIADETFLDQYGLSATGLPATIELPGHPARTATIIGSVPGSELDAYGSVYILAGQEDAFGTDTPPTIDYEMWLPPEVGEELNAQVTSDLKRQLPDFSVDSYRSDYIGDMGESLGPVQNVLLFISILILFMGMLGLVNISMVTIQQRIREIGIRRSFGATSRRIFFSVMMESVVATTIAGAIGVLIAVLVLKAPIVGEFLFDGTATPQVPFTAVIVGMFVSIGIGALAGLVPAIVAMRVRIIDAIRA